MAYTYGIFYIDLASGSDAARTALTTCTASNPAGSTTRINKTGHGLVTGAVVDLTLFSAWLNGAWKITVVDANNFDLDGAVWQATVDANGTVTPRGGSSWADAWLTISSGPTAARIQPGDEIRVAKTVEADSGVDGTFTNASSTVTLSAAVTKTIENATGSAGWTASANITLGNNSVRKIGGNALQITPAAGFTTGKVCYAAIAGGGTQDFSAYSKITFWMRPTTNTAVAANTYRICLCSDATGDTVVNAFNVPALFANSTWQSFVLDYGVALNSSVQSVAIYALVDPGTTVVSINNISACNDISLQTIIGPENEVFYCPQAIDGTTLTIDTLSTSPGGQGWSGSNGTYNLFYANPKVLNIASGSALTTSESGTSIGRVNLIGGWDTGTTVRNGRTYLANIGSIATGVNLNNYANIQFFGIFRFSNGGFGQGNNFENCIISNIGTTPTINDGISFYNCYFLNNSAGGVGQATLSIGVSIFISCIFANNGTFGAINGSQNQFLNCTFQNNASGSISATYGSVGNRAKGTRLYKCSLTDTTEVVVNTQFQQGIVWSYDHDNTINNHWGFANGATINWQTSEKPTGAPGSWRVAHSSTTRGTFNPIQFIIAELACEASVPITLDVWVKKDHATNVACKIYVEDAMYTLDGITSDSAVAADNTSWQQVQISFTPTVDGVVPIWFESWYVAGNSNTYVGLIEITT